MWLILRGVKIGTIIPNGIFVRGGLPAFFVVDAFGGRTGGNRGLATTCGFGRLNFGSGLLSGSATGLANGSLCGAISISLIKPLQKNRHPNYKMQSTHEVARVGDVIDLYYTDPKNVEKQAINVEYNTRYRIDFSNKGTGISSLIIPPGNGIRHILITLGYSASQINTQTGSRALSRGFGYAAIRNITFRVGGSSQYTLTGAQLLARNLRLCRTKSQRDAMLSLGGNECKVAADFDVDQYAYVPVSVFASPSADGISLPLAGDLLSQSIQITCELNPASVFWEGPIAGFGGGDVAPPNEFDTAYFRTEQLVMTDRGMSLANRVDMNANSYGMPLPDFDQQEQTVALPASGASQSVTLTGFRAGECKKILVWLTKDSDVSNPNLWYAPEAVTVLYGGIIFSQYENGESQMWNLLDGTAPAAVEQSALAVSGGAWTSSGVLSRWVELPFSQPTGNDYDGEVLVHGKQILSGLVNLQVIAPTAGDAYTLHAVYVYNSTLSFSRGSAELLF